MIDCNITKNYLKEKKRMCGNNSCSTCPLTKSFPKGTVCTHIEYTNLDKAIKIVQKWSNEHPQKTLLTEFLKHYPKAELNSNGCPDIAPCELGIIKLKDECKGKDVYYYHCEKCWNTPVKD